MNAPKETLDPRVATVVQWLEEQHIPHELHLHADQQGVTSQDASKALGGVALNQILKSLLLQGKDGSFLGAILTGNKKLSFDALQKMLGQKFSFAKVEDIVKQTGYERGGVPPFAFHFKGIPTYVDTDVMKLLEVFGSAGSSTAGVKFSPSVFEKVKYTIAAIGE